ncbi:cerebellar degeneration-related protein 2-like [Brachionichthys hirsutus]|uniref:cerebellar degeneration-related protein 2-like n=1 Tax=Brachionichthys hirsutus TaxID=412623 RepID=UPI00360479D1
MLTGMIVEEEFEMKEEEEEPWYDKQDLEHDLQLAAELGKSLLERNGELEQSLQEMFSTKQEHLQEIEHLTKQVDLLRQVNDQHAKVYEQLDVSSRDLEQTNRTLVRDNRTAQQKIQGLADAAALLQAQVEELQRRAEELKLRPPPGGKRPRRATQSVSCLEELRGATRFGSDPDDPSDAPEFSSPSWREEERASLQQSLRSLQTQFANERRRREASEREAELLAGGNASLERRLAGAEACRLRVAELQQEVEELQQLWTSSSRSPHGLLPSQMRLPPEDEDQGGERVLNEPDSPDRTDDHECSCARRAEVVKYRGISLLSEVDAQCSALQAKYDALLRRCSLEEQQEELQGGENLNSGRAAPPAPTDAGGDFQQPEYKELFREIFSRIQKTEEDLMENRRRRSAGEEA